MMLVKDAKAATSLEQLNIAYMLGRELVIAHHEISALKEENSTLSQENRALTEEVQRLKEQLQLAQSHRFGKKSDVGEPAGVDLPEERVVVAPHTRRKKTKGRLIDTSELPRQRIYHDLAEQERVCGCCHKPLKQIGQEVSEQIEVLPQRLYVVEHVRAKYSGCDCGTIHMAPKEPSPIPKALAGASLLTEVLVNKYEYHLPLYRQSKMLASFNAIVPDNTLGNWVMQLGEGLTPIYKALFEMALAGRYLQVDETPIKILKPEKKGYLWSYFAPHVGQGIVIFELSLTRCGSVAEQRLAPFQGLLQTDGYAGYQGLREHADIEGLGCLSHARRKFSDVLKASKNYQGIAAQAIKHLKPLYALEEQMRRAGYSFHTRKRLRQKIAWPILKEFRHWLKATLPKVPPKSLLAKAICYTLRQWPYLIKYLRHGMAEIDTNWIENKIREIALGRKNWLFMGNENSGAVHALFYSLVSTCLLNEINPRLYLHYVITKIHDIRQNKVDPKKLLPHTIDKDALRKFAQQQIEQGAKILNAFASHLSPLSTTT